MQREKLYVRWFMVAIFYYGDDMFSSSVCKFLSDMSANRLIYLMQKYKFLLCFYNIFVRIFRCMMIFLA